MKVFFDLTVKSNIITCNNILKITAGQGDDYTTGCLLSCSYFKEQYKITAIELSKQQAFHADPK